MRTAQSIEASSRARVESGMAVDADLLSAQVVTSKRKQELIQMQNNPLALALGVSADSVYEPQESLTDRSFPTMPVGELELQAMDKHPDLKRVESERSAQAEAAVSEANTTVGFTRIRAPFDGLVIAKLADAGAMAAPGVPLLTLEDPSRFRLEAMVDESQIGAVRLGASVPVVIDSLGSQAITGKVVQIVPAADPASRTFTGKVDLPANPQVRSGLFGLARFPRGERESILVPQTALLQRGQLDAVFVVGKDEIASQSGFTNWCPAMWMLAKLGLKPASGV